MINWAKLTTRAMSTATRYKTIWINHNRETIEFRVVRGSEEVGKRHPQSEADENPRAVQQEALSGEDSRHLARHIPDDTQCAYLPLTFTERDQGSVENAAEGDNPREYHRHDNEAFHELHHGCLHPAEKRSRSAIPIIVGRVRISCMKDLTGAP